MNNLNIFKEKYSYNDIISYIDKLKHLKILVIGETIIDEYQYGYTLGKSGKSPIAAFKNEYKEIYDGGVKAIYNHLTDFSDIHFNTNGETIKKTRYIEDNQKLFETYSVIKNDEIDIRNINFNLPFYDMVIIADFGHGLFKNDIISNIEDKANFIALNVQRNAGNNGLSTINKYSRPNFICISQHELRLAYSNQYDSVEDILRKKIKNGVTVAITLGRDGCILYRDGEIVKMPALTDTILDSIGAGDTFLSLTSPLAFINAPLEIIAFLGNVAGAIACSYPCNKEYLNYEKIDSFIKKVLND